jgi:predicted oxidoreductase
MLIFMEATPQKPTLTKFAASKIAREMQLISKCGIQMLAANRNNNQTLRLLKRTYYASAERSYVICKQII